MPIFNETAPKETQAELRETATLFSRADEPLKIVTSIEGTAWRSNLFLQVLDSDDVPLALDLGLDPTLQQYKRVLNYEMMLQGELSFQGDNGSGDSIITGEALLYPGVVPNVNDHFIADVADNGLGLFIIKNTERVTYSTKTAYRIEFELYETLTQASKDNLDLKTIGTWYYDSLTKEITESSRGISASRHVDVAKMVSLYYDEFYDKVSETILVPAGERLYDPFISEFWNKVVPRKLRGSHPLSRTYSTETSEYYKKINTVWDLLLTATCYGLDTVAKQMRELPPDAFSSVNIYNGLMTSPINRVVFPKDKKSLTSSIIEEEDVADPYYVLSAAFYNKDEPNYTSLDKLVMDFIGGIRPKYEELIDPINELSSKDPLTRFYELPVYFILVKSAT